MDCGVEWDEIKEHLLEKEEGLSDTSRCHMDGICGSWLSFGGSGNGGGGGSGSAQVDISLLDD